MQLDNPAIQEIKVNRELPEPTEPLEPQVLMVSPEPQVPLETQDQLGR